MSEENNAKKLQTLSEKSIIQMQDDNYERCRSKMISDARHGLDKTICDNLNNKYVELLRSEGFTVKQFFWSPAFVSWNKE